MKMTTIINSTIKRGRWPIKYNSDNTLYIRVGMQFKVGVYTTGMDMIMSTRLFVYEIIFIFFNSLLSYS